MSPAINRPATEFEPVEHKYTLNGTTLLGMSTVAKIGGAEETWGIASAWGYRIGREGALEVMNDWGEPGREVSNEELYRELKSRGLTPWGQRDKAASRGTWVHDVFEALAQEKAMPDLSGIDDEHRGHAQALLKWFVDYRPIFTATEVQVTSERLGVAGRYDIEALLGAEQLVPLFEDHESVQAERVRAEADMKGSALCLIDLKTSKGVYPTTHFPQLSGYELARVEMGFPPTDAQFILNTHPDGTYDFVPSWSTPEDFEGYAAALRSIRRVEAGDPEERRRGRREDEVTAQLPARMKDVTIQGGDARMVKGLMYSMKKQGKLACAKGLWSVCPNAA